MQYDRESGQVYTQEVIRVAPSSRRRRGFAWVHDSPLLPAGWEAYSPVGAHSLKHMAMRAVLSDQRTLSTAHFKGVPWSVARYLWDCVCRSKRTSLYLWKIFATAYPAEFNQISHRYLLKPSSKQMAVTNYLKLLTSASVNWTAVVSLSVEFFEPHEFLEVANVRNLIGLEMCTQPKRTEFGYEATVSISDRVIKGWSEQALTGQAFEHLRILVLRLQTSLTEHVFAYLNAFPTLSAFIMQGCPRLYSKEAREMAERHGWVPFVVHYSDHSLYKIIVDMDSELESQSQEYRPMCINSLPVVDFSLYCRNSKSLHSEEQILFRRKYRATDHLSLQEKKAQKTHNGSDMAPSKPDLKQNKRVVRESCKKDMKGLLDQFKYDSPKPPPSILSSSPPSSW
ncbi:CBS domain-containing protein [Trichophyton equinum CBS 127.97]|uniref:CBS domain-containing protein n=1 Tax=Trichophyton equinum (strain ATCC MYA-4606 / CBS 127.97) TaxID=559882 RepID=F2PJ94_TRIEC|nr:CBS domain-containing protein [Trichophyton equinum CBS 127.97]